MERTDNLIITYIENKSQFLCDLIDDKDTLDGVLTVDVIGFGVDILGDCSTERVFKQSQSDQYVWLKKQHT